MKKRERISKYYALLLFIFIPLFSCVDYSPLFVYFQCLSAGGKVLIHDIDGINIGPCFALAYLINQEKTPHKVGLEILSEKL